MSDVTHLVERYIATWNDTDTVRRRRTIGEIWALDGRYVDPLTVADGPDAIDTTIKVVQARFPGHTFRLAGRVDAHHHLARFTWELAADAGAEPVVVGFDVAVLDDDDGRLREVHGFLDKVPAS
jgi:hypothetical protein